MARTVNRLPPLPTRRPSPRLHARDPPLLQPPRVQGNCPPPFQKKLIRLVIAAILCGDHHGRECLCVFSFAWRFCMYACYSSYAIQLGPTNASSSTQMSKRYGPSLCVCGSFRRQNESGTRFVCVILLLCTCPTLTIDCNGGIVRRSAPCRRRSRRASTRPPRNRSPPLMCNFAVHSYHCCCYCCCTGCYHS